MRSNVYVIGPSGVGKSTIGEILEVQHRVIHKDLDDILAAANPCRERIDVVQDPHLVIPMLDELDRQRGSVPIMLNIGSGAQDMDRQLTSRGRPRCLEPWLLDRAERTVLVEGDRDQLFARWRGRAARELFDLLEYGDERQRIYNIARVVVTTVGVSPTESAAQLADLLSLDPAP